MPIIFVLHLLIFRHKKYYNKIFKQSFAELNMNMNFKKMFATLPLAHFLECLS